MELTKEYFDQQLGTVARKDELEQLRNDLRAMKTDITEIKQTLIDLNKRDKEDSDVFAKRWFNIKGDLLRWKTTLSS